MVYQLPGGQPETQVEELFVSFFNLLYQVFRTERSNFLDIQSGLFSCRIFSTGGNTGIPG